MRIVRYAQIDDLESLVQIDCQVIGNENRHGHIKEAILEKRCLVVRERETTAGFLIFNNHFFGNTFVSLIIVSPEERRKGNASLLLKHVEEISPSDKIFSSTNQSNRNMQKTFQVNGYSQSGKIENLDPGDPEIVYYKPRR
ncbi:GNAT family N-acetyltransferase [Rossellomorea aquimaris]|uniref:Ribosomal protein S18 acetylase RimI-like enzyme n=1 Tax=Rossellomorea aquimaris TaxID=189382 RepID=A0A366F2I7_9BACI|nr:GNAT family N-acetyltransferase [Rossellomorea aquimaris]RBP07915.1 ribosomal protein S18 acetylase RimI-like enzyme [Rossellomorea aquimaris]